MNTEAGFNCYFGISAGNSPIKQRFVDFVGKSLRDENMPIEMIVEKAMHKRIPINPTWAREILTSHMNCMGRDLEGKFCGDEIPLTRNWKEWEENYGYGIPPVCNNDGGCYTFMHKRRGECPILVGCNLELEMTTDGIRYINGDAFNETVCDIGGGPLLESIVRADSSEKAVVVIDPAVEAWTQILNQVDFETGFREAEELLGNRVYNLSEIEFLYLIKDRYPNRSNIYPVNCEFQKLNRVPKGFFDTTVCSFPYPEIDDNYQRELLEYVLTITKRNGQFIFRTEDSKLFNEVLIKFGDDNRFSNFDILPQRRFPLTLFNIRFNEVGKQSEYSFTTCVN